MKIYKCCEQCLVEMSAELYGDFELQFQCSKCKRLTKYILANAKYELLFDMGIIAYDNGYYREAVGNFAASLERFFEFSSWVMLDNMGMPKKTYGNIWKEIRNQSERQYGFFVSVYGLKFNKAFTLNSSMSGFRNRVIHKGEFPSKEETKEYAGYVYNMICDVYFDLISSRLLLYMSDYREPSVINNLDEKKIALADCFISNSIFFKNILMSDEVLSLRSDVISFEKRINEYEVKKIVLPFG